MGAGGGARRGRGGRRKNGRQGSGASAPAWLWVGGAALLLALVVISFLGFGQAGDHHPEPRAGIDHTHVAPAERYAAYPRVSQTYAMVAQIPQLIDGLYCYCACSEHSGHHSLLDCFHDDHGARCDVCLSEASMAYRMHEEGKSLDEIRTAIDRLYET